MRLASLSTPLALGLVSAATLLSELALTRLLSVSLFHHFAFFILSTALAGGGLAGVWLSRRPPKAPAALAQRAAALAAVAMPCAWSLAQWLSLEPLALLSSPLAWLKLALSFLLYALPFSLTALAVIATLQDRPEAAPGRYGADLAGAALGSLLALPALQYVPGPGVLLVASALCALSAALFVPSRRALLLGGAMAVACLFIGLSFGGGLPLHITEAKASRAGRPFGDLLADRRVTLDTRWGPLGRVDRVRFRNGQERLILDAGVAAVRIPKRPVRKSDVTLPYELIPGARVLIIGSGAGYEAKEALALGASQVDAVELNPDIAAQTPPALTRDPRMRLFVEEARAFLEQPGPPYDVILMVHTISNAATAAGALQLAEDYLLTRQAILRMWARLSPQGILLITRPEAQLARLIRVAQTTLQNRMGSAAGTSAYRLLGAEAPAGGGVEDFQRHAFAWAERSAGLSFYAGLMLKRTPFTPEEAARVKARLRGLRLLFGPFSEPRDPLYAGLLEHAPDEELEPLAGGSLSVPTDDRPFFQRRRRLRELSLADLSALAGKTRIRMALESAPLAELSILAVGLVTTLLSALLLLTPLRRSAGGPVASGYFFLLGLAFMLVEVPLVQQLSLLVGHPTRAFSIVFFGLLGGAGAGSALLSRWPTRGPRAALLAAGAVGLYALCAVFVLPRLPSQAAGLRALVALSLSVLLGLVLGRPFPAGLAAMPKPALAWVFSLNTVASVLGSSLALLLSPELGFSGTLAIAAACYAIAAAWGRPARA